MKRRWFGVALALWAVVAPLFAIVSAPVAHADNEQFTFDTVFQNGQLYYMIRGINGAFKSGAELRSPVGSPNIGGLPPGKNVPNTYSSSAALGALDGGCGQMQITNVNPSGTAGVFTATLQYSSSTCAIAQGAIKVFDPNNALGTGSANYTPPAGTGAAGTDPKPECDSGPATFLVCDWLIKPGLWLIDWVQKNIIIPFLQEKPLNNKDADVQPVYAIWSAFRNVASIFFILVFFLVIFGTAIGWDNYTIKKILPRLIAGAILVPFSWFICVIVIDIGNVIGQGLVSLMSSIIPAPKIDFNTPLSSIFLDSALLGVGALAIGFAFTTLSLGVIISVLLAILATFLTLVLRKVFILLLVVLSPFALLAWILPNTTKWFKEWWTNFFKLVMMYPIIMLIFEAGRLFASTAGATFGNGLEKGITPIFAVIGLFGPTFMIPWAFKFAGKTMQVGAGAVGKAIGGLDKRVGKDSAGMKERHERFQNKRASVANDPNRSYLGRGLARKQAGTGGFLMPGGAHGRAKMRAMADKHDSLVGTDTGIRDAEKDMVKEVKSLRSQGKNKEADLLRDSLKSAGRTQAAYEDAKDKSIAKSGDSVAYNKGHAEMKAAANELRSRADKAEAGGDMEGANKMRDRAGEIDNSFKTAGKLNYRSSSTKSSYIESKNEIAAYNEGKKGLAAAADQADAKAIEADARGDAAGAAEHRETATRLREATSTLGKMNYGIDQGRNKGVDSKVAIAAHLKGQEAVETTAQTAEARAAEAEGKATDAHARMATALEAKDMTTFNSASAEARKETAKAESARAEATHLRGTNTILGRASYGTEQGARQMASEKSTMAAHNLSHQEIEAEAAQKERDGDLKVAADLRANLATSGRMTMQVQEAKQKLVAEQAQLAGIARANEVSVPDTGRQLEAQATVQANAVLNQRTQEERMREITIRDGAGNVLRTGRVGTVTPDRDTVRQLEQEAHDAVEQGNWPEAQAKIESLGRSSRGRSAAVRITREYESNEQLKPLLQEATKDMREKTPSAFEPEATAFDTLKPTQFMKMDKREKYRYLQWAQEGDEARKAQAAANVVALSVVRDRKNVDDGDIQFVYGSGFLDDPGNQAAVREALASNREADSTWLEGRHNIVGDLSDEGKASAARFRTAPPPPPPAP